jgi:hypothetical protein
MLIVNRTARLPRRDGLDGEVRVPQADNMAVTIDREFARARHLSRGAWYPSVGILASGATMVADGSHRLLLAQPGAGAERLVEAVRLERLADLGDHLDLACE